MFDSASVNSISSIPSPVYQCKNAFLLNIAVNCSAILLNISWIAVELPTKVTDIFNPFGGISHTDDLMLFGIHSTKYDEFLFCTFNICSSTSFVDILPLNTNDDVNYLPCLGSAAHIMFFASNACCVNSGTVNALYCWDPLDVNGANPIMKKWSLGNGIKFTAIFLKSEFNWPGNLIHVVTPEIAAHTKWFKSP